MFKHFFRRRNSKAEIFPEEILLDSHAHELFNTAHQEGRIERRVEQWRFLMIFGVFCALVIGFSARAATLQVKDGAEFADRSENNRLDSSIEWAHRGVIYDRTGMEIAWNEEGDQAFNERVYSDLPGLTHTLGFVRYPKKDNNGYFIETAILGVSGVEEVYNDALSGKNGRRLVESKVTGEKISESVIDTPVNGADLHLTIDARVQSELHESIARLSNQAGFTGGGGVIIDSFTGEVIALTSYPEYDRDNVGEDIPGNPFLNRATQGLYTPGSIVKPIVAIAGLTEGVITPSTRVMSSNRFEIPNPYNPSQPTVYHDWKGFGMLDVRSAIAYSPNSFFFAVGGGYGGVKGVGISKIEEYMKAFGIGEEVSVEGFSEASSVVPNPSWKREHFDGDDWRLGDTFLTSIGQYGFQVTPLHMARAVAAIANGGKLVSPTLSARQTRAPKSVSLDIPESAYQVVREGMEKSADFGTAKSLKLPYVQVAAKTGTAELGVSKDYVNSWVVGYFPAETRRYTFAVVMERAPRANMYGATLVMRDLLEWMHLEYPTYISGDSR